MPLRDIKQQKAELRVRVKKQRADCPADIKRRLDEGLTANVLSLEEYRKADTVFTFVSMPIECDTYGIIEDALSSGKRVAVPKCKNREGEMEFYYITSLSDLKKGYFSTMEPDTERCERAEDISGGVCIVPGLCFDFQGYRLGFGGGYYDRFLSKFGGTSVGISYSRFVEQELPRGAFDRQTDILITEKYINYTQKF